MSFDYDFGDIEYLYPQLIRKFEELTGGLCSLADTNCLIDFVERDPANQQVLISVLGRKILLKFDFVTVDQDINCYGQVQASLTKRKYGEEFAVELLDIIWLDVEGGIHKQPNAGTQVSAVSSDRFYSAYIEQLVRKLHEIRALNCAHPIR